VKHTVPTVDRVLPPAVWFINL